MCPRMSALVGNLKRPLSIHLFRFQVIRCQTETKIFKDEQAVDEVGIVFYYPLGSVQARHLTDITDTW